VVGDLIGGKETTMQTGTVTVRSFRVICIQVSMKRRVNTNLQFKSQKRSLSFIKRSPREGETTSTISSAQPILIFKDSATKLSNRRH
jgi:hypothetical protein